MAFWAELARRLRYVGGRSRFDRELDEEIRFHIQARATELEQAGVPPRTALDQARREFGPPARAREDTRAAWQFRPIEDLFADLRYAARTFRRQPTFALTAIACLALAIGVNTTIYSLTMEMLFSQPSARDPGSLYQIQIGGSNAAVMRDYRFIRDARIFDALAGENEETEVNWRDGDKSYRLFTDRVTDNFFTALDIPVAMGRPIEPGDTNVVELTYGFWQRRLGGDPNVVGRSLVIDGRPHVVVGVLPRDHRTVTGFGFAPDLYLPVAGENERVVLYARFPQGMSRQVAYARLAATCEELDRMNSHGQERFATGIKVTSASGADRFRDEQALPIAAFFVMLMVVVGLLLLIACANVAGLLLARASSRTQELAIRLSIGAGRGRIVRQLLTESLLLAICGTGAGLVLNLALTSYLNRFHLPLPVPIQVVIQPDWRLLAYSIGIALVSTLVTGLMPALRGSREGLHHALKQDERQVRGGGWSLRDALVVGQLAVSIVLLSAGFLFLRNLLRASTVSPGFDLERTVWATMRLVPEAYQKPEKTRAVAAAALEGLRSLPGVEAASIARTVPLNTNFTWGTQLTTDLSTQPAHVYLHANYVSGDYFRVMQIPIVAGREFSASDRLGSPRVAILSERMAASLFGNANPIGHAIRFTKDAPIAVVGVAKDSKYFTLGEDRALGYYEPYAQREEAETELQFLIRSEGNPESMVAPVNQALARFDSSAAIEAKPMRRALTFALLPSRVGAAILGSAGLLGLVLAAIGLYGVLAYAVSRRIREIGLRVALGATPGNVLRLVLRQSLALLAIGLGIGIALAVFAVRPLAMFLTPEIHAADASNFIVVAAVFCVVALMATISPALRALRVDPGVALRYE